MKHIVHALAAAGCLAFGLAGPAVAQNNFYAGKTISLMVGTGPGGGYDLYARALAATMPKHIPGSPAMIVQNMNAPLPTANHVLAAAPKDGTVIGLASSSFVTYQILGGSNTNYDATKIAWLGRLWNSNVLMISWAASGVKTIDDAKAKEIPYGGLSASHATSVHPLLTNKMLGTKFKIVSGYVSEEMDLALERGEISAYSRMTVEGLLTRYDKWTKDNKVNVLMQIGDKRDPRMPNVPTFKELASSQRDKQMLDLVTIESDFGHSYFTSADVPADRLAILRDAFKKTVEDPEFKAAMEKMRTAPTYGTPEYLAKRVADVAALPADIKAEAAAIILPK